MTSRLTRQVQITDVSPVDIGSMDSHSEKLPRAALSLCRSDECYVEITLSASET